MTEVQFGYKKVTPDEKANLVGEVFRTVADRYDAMNDLMSFGMHRVFKRMVVQSSGVRPGHCVLDLAGGTGDMSALFAKAVGPTGQVILTDPNAEMMAVGKERLLNKGLMNVRFCHAPAEALPFADNVFDVACISFGIRNFTDKDAALTELLRVLKPGAALGVLEFSKPQQPIIKGAYETFQALWPLAGRAIAGDAEPYRYLIESIRVHPDQKALKQMFGDAGFTDVEYYNLIGGIAAIHRGVKPRPEMAA